MLEVSGPWFPSLEEAFNPSTRKRAEGQSASLREKPARFLQEDTGSGREYGDLQIPSAMYPGFNE